MNAQRIVRQLLTALALATTPAGAATVPTLSPDELSPGQEATVHTVFQGHRVETFDAVIVGVLRSGRAAGDLILARATTERVVRTGIAQGMSGSPVYVNGKLIGALSSGWPFSREPLFGITPIGEMLEVLEFPTDRAAEQTAGPAGIQPVSVASPQTFRQLSWSEPALETESLPDAAIPQALPLPLAATGLNGDALSWASKLLEPMGLNVIPGGVAESGGPGADSIVPGSSVAVDMMRGDLQFSAIGTVTWREGDRVLLFGHPFFQAGQIRMPLSTAEITTVVGSDFSSFKLGARGRHVGIAEQDRRAAVSGRIGPSPELIPFRVDVTREAGPSKTFRFESIQDRTLTPTLLAIAGFNSLVESGGTAGNQTMQWTLTVYRADGPPLVLTDVVAGEGPPAEVTAGVSAPLGFLFANPYAPVAIDSIGLLIEARRGRNEWTVREARPDRARVQPGDRLRVTYVVEQWRGDERTAHVDVEIPEELTPGTYELRIGGGQEMTRFESQQLPARFRPTSLDEAWRRLAESRPADAVYVALISPSPEITSRGHDYAGLPLSARSILKPPTRGRDTRAGVTWISEKRVAWDGHLGGETVVPVLVELRAP